MKARLPKGMGGGAQNMQSMIKQAQKMQEEMEKTQEELNEKEYTTSSGGGKKLPQTGQLWWPVPVLACAGLGCIAVGLFRRREARDEG